MKYFKLTFYWLLVYLAFGFFYNMIGEYKLALKYARLENRKTTLLITASQVMVDPYAYLRSIIFSFEWPFDLYESIYHSGYK